MFRKGGEVGGGIMSGINRENYQEGTPSARERYEAIVQKYAQPAVDPISQLLIQGGLRGLSQTGGGGTLGNLAMAFEQPTSQLFQNLQKQKELERTAELAGLEMDLSEEERQRRIAREDKLRAEDIAREEKYRAEDIAREEKQFKETADLKKYLGELSAKQKDFFAAQTPEEQFEVLFEGYQESNIPAIKSGARNLASFEVGLIGKNENYTQLGFQYNKKAKSFVPNWSAIPVGSITYNPQTNLAYRRITREANTAQDYIPLNPNTLQPLE
jgi:hypothetical protein